MAGPAPGPPHLAATPLVRLGEQERAVLSALYDNRHRVLSRRELARLSGLTGLSERRCDSVLVGVRRALGADSIQTIRGRGWRIDPTAVDAAAQLLA